MMDKLPFKVVKGGGTTLVRQIVDGFRRSIDFGFYRPGDMLPSLREVSKETGVSLIVVREAFQRLSAEGFVSPRRGIGSIVTDRQAYAWRGHIVIASVEIRENHLISAMTGALRKSLMEAGYMVSTVPFGSEPSTYDFSQLDSVLRTPVTLVVATSSNPAIDRHLAKQKTPFLTFGDSAHAVASMRIDCTQAIADFVAHCRETGVQNVLEVFVGNEDASIRDAMRAAAFSAAAGISSAGAVSWKYARGRSTPSTAKSSAPARNGCPTFSTSTTTSPRKARSSRCSNRESTYPAT